MIPARLVPLWRAVTKAGFAGSAFNLYGAREQLRPLRREDLWRYVMAMSEAAGLTGDMADGVIRFHGLRHHLVSWHIARGVSFAHDAYWIGHQTAGAELLHPAGNGSLKSLEGGEVTVGRTDQGTLLAGPPVDLVLRVQQQGRQRGHVELRAGAQHRLLGRLDLEQPGQLADQALVEHRVSHSGGAHGPVR